MKYTQNINSPVGLLTLASDGENLTGLWLKNQKHFARNLDVENIEQNLPIFEQAEKWISDYFEGKNPEVSPRLAPKGTSFQKQVWDILQQIPYGQTLTYGEIADKISSQNGKKTSARAVGTAVGRNPISIIIPCHRVIGKDGSLTGFAGGLDKKTILLRIEGVQARGLFG